MTLSEWVDLLAKIGGLGALVITPIVGAYKYIKNRTYAVRLELSISAEVLQADGETFLRLGSAVKNVGNARVNLKPENSYVRVCKMESVPSVAIIEPEALVALFILQDAHALESGQAKDDSQIVKVPHSNYLAFHIEVGVTSKGVLKWLRGRDWTKTLIINCKLKPDTTN